MHRQTTDSSTEREESPDTDSKSKDSFTLIRTFDKRKHSLVPCTDTRNYLFALLVRCAIYCKIFYSLNYFNNPF